VTSAQDERNRPALIPFASPSNPLQARWRRAAALLIPSSGAGCLETRGSFTDITKRRSWVQPRFDGREMVMVHDMFRREFALLPGLVDEVPTRNDTRAQLVGDHIEALIAALDHHHRSEDEYVWPLLVDRCAESAAALTAMMQAQHDQVGARIHEVNTALEIWRSNITTDSRKSLVEALDRLIASLRQHLIDEERQVVPLMEQYITAAEFLEMVRNGATHADPDGLPLGFGMLMYEGHPEVVDRAIAGMAAEARPIIRGLAAQAFADHSQRIHGTATPPRSTEL